MVSHLWFVSFWCVIKSHKELVKEALREGNNTIRLSSTSIVAKNYSIVYQFQN